MKNALKVLGPTLTAIGTYAVVQLAPVVQAWIAAHPKYSAAASVVGWIVAHWLPSPLQPTKTT